MIFAVSEMGDVGVDISYSVTLATDFSKVEILEAMSAMMVLFVRRLLGPAGG